QPASYKRRSRSPPERITLRAPVSGSLERTVVRNGDAAASSGTSIARRRGPLPLVTIGRSNRNVAGAAVCCAVTVAAPATSARATIVVAVVLMRDPLQDARRISGA